MFYKTLEKYFMLIVLVFTVIFSFSTSYSCASPENTSYQKETINKTAETISEKIELVDKYQEKYFEIIKRNNVLLQCEDVEQADKDLKELENLFAEVENKITNKHYLKKYIKIQKKFSECSGETTIDINNFAEENYKAIDKLQKNVYKKAKSKISSNDLKKFESSEKKWEKEVKNYKKVFNTMGFGTIGTSTYYNYIINMKEYRTLLLMMYL